MSSETPRQPRQPHPDPGAQPAGGWQPTAQGGEYDSDATAFVQLPEGFLDSSDAQSGRDPLAAPGHGYAPPPIAPASADPSATGPWTMPYSGSGQEQQGQYGQQQGGGQADRDGSGAGPHQQVAWQQPGRPGQGDAAGAGWDDPSGAGRWTVPPAADDAPDESGEYMVGGVVGHVPGAAPGPWTVPGAATGDQWEPAPSGGSAQAGGSAQPVQHGLQQGRHDPSGEHGPQERHGHQEQHGQPGQLTRTGPPAQLTRTGPPAQPVQDLQPGQWGYASPDPQAPVLRQDQAINIPAQGGAWADPWVPRSPGPEYEGAGQVPDGRSGTEVRPGSDRRTDTHADAHSGPGLDDQRPGSSAADRSGQWPAAGDASSAQPHGTPAARPGPAHDSGGQWPAQASDAGVAPGGHPPDGAHGGALADTSGGPYGTGGQGIGPDTAGSQWPTDLTDPAGRPRDGGGDADRTGAPAHEYGRDETGDRAPAPSGDARTAERDGATGQDSGPGPDSARAEHAEAGVEPGSDRPDAADGARSGRPAGPDGEQPDTGQPDTEQPAPAGVVPSEAPPTALSEHPCASYVLSVNGTDRPVTDSWIGESLLYVLRERLGLAGAKDGCSQGECGACSVQVDGRLVASCLVPAATTAGSEVRTVEGLAADGTPSDVQRALASNGAIQCGFCVPGLAMTVHDLLEGNHAPTELQTRKALCGNLCRCSGYRGVLDAVRDVVESRADSADAAAHTAAKRPGEDAGRGPEAYDAPEGHGADAYGTPGAHGPEAQPAHRAEGPHGAQAQAAQTQAAQAHGADAQPYGATQAQGTRTYDPGPEAYGTGHDPAPGPSGGSRIPHQSGPAGSGVNSPHGGPA